VALQRSPGTSGPGIAIVATPVPLNTGDPYQGAIPDYWTTITIGDRGPVDREFAYAGGLTLSSSDTARLHGLSDVAITADGRLTAISDEGDLFQARLALDRTGRLVGLTGGKISALSGLDGKPLPGKLEADSEGLAILANGDRLVSFELHHRIWLYPADGGTPRAAPWPKALFPPNGGMEALAPDPTAGPDAYVVGGEESGQTWTCRVSTTCTPGPVIPKPPEFGLVAVARLPEGRTAWLLRTWDAARGNRVTLTIRDAQREVGRMDLAKPLTIDNFEGLAALPAKDGSIRFYLLSDDNFQRSQQTLLLAFDWKAVRRAPQTKKAAR
jgi:hypothetical protein